jgi:putative endonuclease
VRKDERTQTGRRGEQIAADHLLAKGYRILERNWRCPSGEIDIVAEDGGVLVFVEVRTRKMTGAFGTAAESVRPRKQRKVSETAQVYMYRNKAYGRPVRFDVVAVELDARGDLLSLQHIEQAF